MLTNEERKEALRELSFNRWKALKLFCFCFASFIVGLTALYWTLDYRYAERIAVEKERLLKDMAALQDHYSVEPIADLYEGVIAYEGKADFDNAHVIATPDSSLKEKGEMVAVSGQKRELAPSVYEVRFVLKENKAAQSQDGTKEATEDTKDSAKS